MVVYNGNLRFFGSVQEVCELQPTKALRAISANRRALMDFPFLPKRVKENVRSKARSGKYKKRYKALVIVLRALKHQKYILKKNIFKLQRVATARS